MPTYKALGISASLLVADLNPTLSDKIVFTMGPQHQADATRIRSHLANGRVLQERPIGPDDSTVGVLQFVGEDTDMGLLIVEVEDAGKTTNSGSSRTNATFSGDIIPNQTWTKGRKKGKGVAKAGGNSKARSSKDLKAKPETHSASAALAAKEDKESQSGTDVSVDFLALSIKVDCTDFLESKTLGNLRGKDLKLEVFINGKWGETIYECGRSARRRNIFLLSGTRFHRQAEKPWVYAPSAETNNKGAIFDERWASISQALQQEASQRGMDQYNQRPLSAQFLLSLARLRLPTTVLAKGKNFAVIDLVVTAGEGGKYGPETTYITKPDSLKDKNFSDFAPVAHDRHGLPTSLLRNRVPHHIDTHTLAQSSHTAPIPQTPRQTTKANFRNYKEMLDSAPMRKLLSTYENSNGKPMGARTLKQRVGDMAKMSPERRKKVLEELKGDLDEDTVEAVKKVFEKVEPAQETPTRNKRVCFSAEFTALGQVTADQPTSPFGLLDPRKLSFNAQGTVRLSASAPENSLHPNKELDNDPVLFQTNSRFASEESLVGHNVDNPANFHVLNSEQSGDSAIPSNSQLGFDDRFIGQNNDNKPQDSLGLFPELQCDNALQQNSRLLFEEALVPDPSPKVGKGATETTAPEDEKMSASDKSPTLSPPKRHRRASQRKREADADTKIEDDDDEPLPSPTVRASPKVAKPQTTSHGAKRIANRWNPQEVTSKEALEDLKTPELWDKIESPVTYADGLKQRQVPKARGGKFIEQQFVLGMRFVVM